MRYLAIVSFSFAAGVFGAVYLLPEKLWILLAAALAVLCPLALLLRFWPKGRKGAALICGGLAAGLLWTAAYTAVFYAPTRQLDGKTVRLTGTVTDYARQTAWGWSVPVKVKTESLVTIPTLLYVDKQGSELCPGEQIETVAHCTLAERTFSGAEVTYFTAKGIFLRGVAYGELKIADPEHIPASCWPAVLSQKLKTGIDRSFSGDVSALVKALVTGNRDSLSDPFTSSLQRTGLSHTVAVSGMHVAFLAGALSLLLGRGRRRTALVLIPLVLLFMTVAGSTPSVVRASVMILLLEIAPLLDRERDGPTALGFALLLILIQNPFAAAHVGLQLSFLAVAGIFCCADTIQGWIFSHYKLKKRKRFTPMWLLDKVVFFVGSTLSATLGAMVFTTPLVALYFGSVSIISLLANLLTLWAVGLVFMGGLFSGVLAMASPVLGAMAAAVITPLAQYLNWVIPKLSNIPFAALTMDSFYYRVWLLLVYAVLLAGVLLKGEKRIGIPAAVCAVTLCAAIALTVSVFRSGAMAVAVLDVGQGESVLLRCGEELILVDCGGDSQTNAGDIAADYIQNMGGQRLNLLVITHFHDDHANGVPQLLERVPVDAVALPVVTEDSALRQEIIATAQKKQIPMQEIDQDRTITPEQGGVLRLFAPLGAGETNEEGLSVLASSGDFDVLITGDMGGDVEQLLLEHVQLPHVELMVAGHHGSKYSTSSELLSAIQPETAVISVGADNRYGHPAQETLERLAAAGTELYRTDLQGTVLIRALGK